MPKGVKPGIKIPEPSQPNFPKDSKKPAYPEGNKMPTADNFDNNLKPQVGDTYGVKPADSEMPVGGQMQGCTDPKHQRAVEMDQHRSQSPAETGPTLSPRQSYGSPAPTQKQVMEHNDPTHDDKHGRSWEDGNFENRRMFY